MNYYYLVASLPSVFFGMEKLPIQRTDFEERLRNNFSVNDFRLYAATTQDFYVWEKHAAENPFLQGYALFEKNLRTFLVGVNMKKTGKNFMPYIAGADDIVADAIRHSNASDFGLGKELPYAGQVIELIEQKKYYELEQFVDRIRFKKISAINSFHYFDLNRVLGYSFQLSIIERWIGLTEDEGKKRLDALSTDDVGKDQLYQLV